MARLQILELPEGSGDDRPPFVLVVDQYTPQRYILGLDQPEPVSEFDGIAEKIGARAVLVFEETVDIPANDNTAYLPGSEVHNEATLKLGDRDVRNAIAVDAAKMRAAHEDRILDSRQALLDAERPAHERTEIARDMDRLAKRRDELTDALGMNRTRDWDDIRNAAAGLRKQRDAQAAELERLRAGEEAVTERGVIPTPAQWIWLWNQHTPEKRLDMAAQILDNMAKANECFMADHEARITSLRGEVERLRNDTERSPEE